MASFKALAIMIVWTVAAVWLMNFLGLAESSRELVWTLVSAVFLLAILMVNVWIFFVVAKDEPWKWLKS